MADIHNGTVTISGIDAFEKKLKQLGTENPGFRKRLSGVIRKVLGEVRANLSNDAQSGLQMKSDPRKAYKAVRYAVYKTILGGQVNILPSSKTVKSHYDPPRKGLPRRGGNRRLRSQRTQDMLDYEGISRGFVLRFLNAGTAPRYNGGRNGQTYVQRKKFIADHDGRAFRGSIAPRNWFGPRSQQELENAAVHIQEIIDRVIKDEFV